MSRRQNENFFVWAGSPTYPSPGGVQASPLLGAGHIIFEECGVQADRFALPRQHALSHYPSLIRAFGVPNGLCSSITESKHIKAVKEPWRCSGRHEALGQMLLTNQQLDKLAVSHVDFRDRGMLDGTCLESKRIRLSLRESFSLPLGVSHINKYLPCVGHCKVDTS